VKKPRSVKISNFSIVGGNFFKEKKNRFAGFAIENYEFSKMKTYF